MASSLASTLGRNALCPPTLMPRRKTIKAMLPLWQPRSIEERCGPRRLLLRHLDVVCVGGQRVTRCVRRERSGERAERQGGVHGARLRGMLGVAGHVEPAQ